MKVLANYCTLEVLLNLIEVNYSYSLKLLLNQRKNVEGLGPKRDGA